MHSATKSKKSYDKDVNSNLIKGEYIISQKYTSNDLGSTINYSEVYHFWEKSKFFGIKLVIFYQ